MMIVDWRKLFDHLGIAWRDRGSNCVRGNVNIACPWCKNDPSFHLGVSEEREAFYCYRDSRHAGRKFTSLLYQLGIVRERAIKLLNLHKSADTKAFQDSEPAPIAEAPSRDRAWAQFESATRSPIHLDYLESRGFPTPRTTAELYDLRYAPVGTWALRLLLPFREDGRLITWAGRAVTPRLEKKYLMEEVSSRGMIYIPRLPRKTLVICEGPLDALKVAVATEAADVSAVALAGKGLNADKLMRIGKLAQNCEQVLVALDADVKLSEAYTFINELAGSLRTSYVRRCKLPAGYKDPGAMPVELVREWVRENIDAKGHDKAERPAG